MKHFAYLAIAVGLVVSAASACLRSTAYTCADSAACGANGRCEPTGYCSAPDSACNGNRYGDSAGPYAGQCVAALEPDAGPGSGSGSGSGMPDAAPRCPADFAPLAGGAGGGHVYKVMQPDDTWDHWLGACHDIDHTYLAVPDDAAELAALAALATPPTWIGIHKGIINNTWITAKDASLISPPWKDGNPDNGQGKDCVQIHSATEVLNDMCGGHLAGICECEP